MSYAKYSMGPTNLPHYMSEKDEAFLHICIECYSKAKAEGREQDREYVRRLSYLAYEALITQQSPLQTK